MSERLTDAAIREAMAPRPWAPGAFDHDLRRVAVEALARGTEVEGLRAEVTRVTRERDEAHENLTRLADYALCGTGGVEDVGHPPESHEPPTGIVPRTAYDAIGKWRAEVARLRAALDEELSTDCEFTGEPNHSNCACCFKPDGSECGDPCDHHKAWRDERDRLRAAAIPEDAEDRAAEVMWARAVTRLGDASLPWTAMSDDGHVKRFWREEARAVVKALRGQA